MNDTYIVTRKGIVEDLLAVGHVYGFLGSCARRFIIIRRSKGNMHG